MEGACIPWQNKHDVQPLIVNAECDYIVFNEIPGIRIYRDSNKSEPFDIYFCKTRYNAYQILMGLDKQAVEARIVERSRKDQAFKRKSTAVTQEEAEELCRNGKRSMSA
jgi:Lon-like ATP-dependent protease